MNGIKKAKSDDFGELEYVKPVGRYTAFNLGGGAAVLMRAKDARDIEVGFKRKKNSMVIYLEKKRVKREKQ